MYRKFCSALLVAALLAAVALVPAQAGSFADTQGHRASDAIDMWSYVGVLNGYEDGSFRPDGSITRAELAAVLCRMLGAEVIQREMDTPDFQDVPEEAWFYRPMLMLHEMGIMTGDGNGVMRPNDSITREEAVVLMGRATHLTADVPAASTGPADAAQLADWARTPVCHLYQKGHLGWVTGGRFEPQKAITRAEVAETLYSMIPFYTGHAGMADHELVGSIDETLMLSKEAWLRNTHLTGDLILADGIFDGGVVLENTVVEGTLHVGGAGWLHLMNGVRFNKLALYRSNLCISTFGETAEWLQQAHPELGGVAIVDKYGTLTLFIGEYAYLPLATVCNAVDTVTVRSDATLYLPDDMHIERLIANAPVTLQGQGSIGTLEVHSDGVLVDEGMRIDHMAVDDGLQVAERYVQPPLPFAESPR